MIYRWLVLLHVLGVFGFLMAHGISAAVAFTLRRERRLDHIQTLLNLSSSTLGFLHGSILILLLTGVINGFLGHWWGKGWIWVSLGLLIAIYVFMGAYASSYYSKVRKAAGVAFMDGFKPHPPLEPACPEDIDALLTSSRPITLAVAGFGSLAVLAWLMMAKPF